jgi:hypothetical protein
VVVVKVFVDGTNVRPVAVSAAWLPDVDEPTKTGKKVEAEEFVAVVAMLVALVAVVAVVAVEALPVKAPTKVVVVRVLVLGLNVKPVAVSMPWLPDVLEETKVGKKDAFVEFVAVVATFVALVAVVAVVALPDSAPEKVVVVSVLVLGLNVRPVAVSMAWLLDVFDETKVGKKDALVVTAPVVATFVALVAVVAVVAVEALPVKAPTNVVVVSVAVDGL